MENQETLYQLFNLHLYKKRDSLVISDANPEGVLSSQIVLNSDSGVSVNPEDIQSGSIAGNLEYTGGYIQSANFVSGSAGWKLSSDGIIEAIDATLSGVITGATIQTSTSGTRFVISPTQFQGINSTGETIFEIIISGANAGDVIMGDDAAGSYAQWDNSAGTFNVFGSNISPTFGDGSDGDVTIGAGTTTLTRDMYYNNLTITGTLQTDGYKVHVKATLNGTGTIAGKTGGNGGNASGVTAGSAGAESTSGPIKGRAGVAGGSNGAGAGGAAGTSGLFGSFGSSGTQGGSGGSGGNPGGAGGAVGAVTTAQTKMIDKTAVVGMIYLQSDTVAIQKPCGSSGGGQGGGSGASPSPGAGGGSGASGGTIWVAAKTWAGTFTISSVGGNGGNGGNGTAGGGDAGGGGGGAGGNGGSTLFIYETKTWTGSYVLTAGTGGSGGTGAGSGGNGGNGATGNTGTSFEFDVLTLL